MEPPIMARDDDDDNGPRRRRSGYKAIISNSNLRALLVRRLGPKLAPQCTFRLADANYYCPPIADLRKIVRKDKADRKEWISQKFDCDDFALALKYAFIKDAYRKKKRRAPYCVGMIWGNLRSPQGVTSISVHALNVAVTNRYNVVFIEPQNDLIFPPRERDRNIEFVYF